MPEAVSEDVSEAVAEAAAAAVAEAAAEAVAWEDGKADVQSAAKLAMQATIVSCCPSLG